MDSDNNKKNKSLVKYEADAKNNDGGENSPDKKSSKLNLPNKLTVFRVLLVPAFMLFILFPANEVIPPAWCKIFAAALFVIAAITDLLDGIIARRLKLITNFGKLMDPLADKFMIVGALIAITASDSFAGIRWLAVWVTTAVFFRELAVTSVRLIANTSEGNVIAASFIGKIKTFMQCACILTILLEDVIITQTIGIPYLFSYITMVMMLIITVYSGIAYVKTYWKYIDPAK
jgi:CDP-diacylglycerol--glycerol-3-phosphate 3-phosphatidyltransferase